MKRIGLYARYSTDEQDKASIEDQLRVCRAHAMEKLDASEVADFVDEAISGSSTGNRPGLQRMLAEAFNGKLAAIVVIDLTRLARGEDLPTLIRRLTFRDVLVVGVQDGFRSDSQNARMHAGFASVIGGSFIEMISRRTYSALEMRAMKEMPTGGRSYGYNKDRTPNESEAAVVRELFSRFASGDNMKILAADFNARAIPSPGASWARKTRRQDGRWLVSGVHTILHNELYTGRVIWNRRQFRKDPDTGKRTCRERPQSEWKIYDDPSRALIDQATWDQCQARLGGKGGGRKGPVRYILSGILKCGNCGSRMIVYGGKGHRYVCGTFHGGGPAACSNRITVPRRTAEELILAPVISDLTSPAIVDHMVQQMRAELKRQQVRPAISPDVERIDGEIANLRKLVADGLISGTRAAPAIAAAELERQAFTRESQRQNEPQSVYTTEELRASFTDAAKSMLDVLQGSDIAAARMALGEYIGTVQLMPSDTYLVAHYERSVLGALATGTGVDKVVAGVRFESIYPPVALIQQGARRKVRR